MEFNEYDARKKRTTAKDRGSYRKNTAGFSACYQPIAIANHWMLLIVIND
jgi:hypothetical protein